MNDLVKSVGVSDMNSGRSSSTENPLPGWPSRERRHQQERRQYSLRSLYCCAINPRRATGRRLSDRKYPILDVFDSGVVALVVLLIAFSILDAVFTLTLIQLGGSELNPIMDYFLQLSISEFMLVKLSLTAIPALILAALGNVLIMQRFRARSILAALVGMYAGLLVYEVGLLSLARAV